MEKAAETTFVRKTLAYKVDEIDSWGQFHQHLCTTFSCADPKKH